MIAFLLMLLAAGPQPGELKTFGDWTVGCDNVKRCTAVSLVVEDGLGDASMRIEREAGPAGGWTVTLTPDQERIGTVQVKLDGVIVASGQIGTAGLTVTGGEADGIVRRMANGRRLVVERVVDGRVASTVSLTGASATLRHIDAEQGRAGTVTAVVARGTRPARDVPKPRPLPAVVQVRAPRLPAEPVSPRLRQEMEAETGCSIDEVGGPRQLETHRLDARTTLVLLPCGAGAYNFITVPLLLQRGRYARASFDQPVGFSPDGEPVSLVNASWDQPTARLSEYAKARGLGDCGTASEFAWDGTRFRLIRRTAMGECRGSVDWIPIWRATAIR